MEQTEQDFREIERAHELPPDELYTIGDDGPWCVEFDGEIFGPFDSEDDCYTWAASHSREPNDWTPKRMSET